MNDETVYEPCPACRGTGVRPVAPPPLRRGHKVNRNGEGRAHGFQATYVRGCRCDLCRSAWRQQAAVRRAKAQAPTDLLPGSDSGDGRDDEETTR